MRELSVGRAAVIELARIARHGTLIEIESAGAWLMSLDGAGWLRLDDEARRFSYVDGGRPVSGVQGWLGPSAGEVSGVVAAVTSLHTDGRIRQRATQILAGRPGVLRARALAVRCLDHVPQVRDDALLGLKTQVLMLGEGFEAAVDVLLAGRGRQGGPAVLAEVLAAVEAARGRVDVVRRLMSSASRRRRLWGLELGGEVLSVPELVTVVSTDADQAVRRASVGLLGRRATSAQLESLLRARFVDARVLAFARVGDVDLPDDVILTGLLDPAARVRAEALVRARRRGMDAAGHYREVLERQGHVGTGGVGVVVAALTGVGALGSREHVAVVERWLTDPRPGPRAAAVTAYAHLSEVEQVTATLMPCLHDPSPTVTAAAARAIVATGLLVDEDELEPVWRSEQPWSRRAAWRMTRSRSGWARVDADVRAATDPDNTLRSLGRDTLRAWLDHGAATTWGRPNAAQAARIASALDTDDLPGDVAMRVAFHAGLPRPHPLATPSPDSHVAALADERSRWQVLRERLLPKSRTPPNR